MRNLSGKRDRENQPLRLGTAEREFIRALFLEHSRALRGYAASLGFPGDAGEDLLQETFLIAIRRVDTLRACEAPNAYLLRILRNVIGYRLRSMKYAAALAERLERPEETWDETDPETLYRGAVSDGELRLLLRYYRDGLSQRELAEELGIELGALKMRLKRAKERLRKALEEERPG